MEEQVLPPKNPMSMAYRKEMALKLKDQEIQPSDKENIFQKKVVPEPFRSSNLE